jgi:hypothetical protein
MATTGSGVSGYTYVSSVLREDEDKGIQGNISKLPYKSNSQMCDHTTSICAGELPEDSLAYAQGDRYCALSWNVDYKLFLQRTEAGRRLEEQLRTKGVEVK